MTRKTQRKYIPMPSQEYLKNVFDYDEATGILRWRNHPFKQYKNGSVVGYQNKKTGYWQVLVDGEQYRVHRIIWMWMNGEDPKEMEIDHIDGAPNNNRIDNLRVATRSVNMRNKKKFKNNTSGCTGVYEGEFKDGKNWIARMSIGSDRKYKRFYTYDEAVAQRLVWEKEIPSFTGRRNVENKRK